MQPDCLCIWLSSSLDRLRRDRSGRRAAGTGRGRASRRRPRRRPRRPNAAVTDYHAQGRGQEGRRRELEQRDDPPRGDPRLHGCDDDAVSPTKTEPCSDTLQPGDSVEGTLRVEKEDGVVSDYELRDLKVTKPAPPRRWSSMSRRERSSCVTAPSGSRSASRCPTSR